MTNIDNDKMQRAAEAYDRSMLGRPKPTTQIFADGAAWADQQFAQQMMKIGSYAAVEPLKPYQSEADKAIPSILGRLERIAHEQDCQFMASRIMAQSIDQRLDRLLEIAETPTILPQMGSTAPDPDYAEVEDAASEPDWNKMYREAMSALDLSRERIDLLEKQVRAMAKAMDAALLSLRQ